MQRPPRSNSLDEPKVAWATAVANVRRQIKNEDYRLLRRITSYQECFDSLTKDKNAFSKKWKYVKQFLEPCFDVLQTFDRAIGTCCQSKAEIACLVWGSVQILLTIAAKFSDCAQRVSEMLHQMSCSMPRFEQYSLLFPDSARLQLRLVDIYANFVMFCIDAFKFFKYGFLTVWIKMTWKSLDKRFGIALNKIERDRAQLEDEASAANIVAGFQREEAAKQRHEGLLKTLPVALETARLIKPTLIIPFDRNTEFVGRESELKKMQDFAESHSSQTRLKAISIRGIGGMGKTQLALEFTYRDRNQPTPTFKAMFWIRSENITILEQDFANIGRVLTGSDADLHKNLQVSHDWLSATDESWLLVFDNVDDVDTVLSYWPHSGKGTIIVTTRDRDIAYRLGELNIELEGLSEDEGANLLGQIEPRMQSSQKAREVCDELGRMPLALCQMGSYIRQTQCNLDDFLRALRQHSDRLYSDQDSISSLQYSQTLATCCDLSIGLLSQQSMHLLGVLAFFQTDEVLETLITQGCSSVPRLEYLNDCLGWDNSIRTLAKHSLITRQSGTAGQVIRMHRVIKRRVFHILDSKMPDGRVISFADAAHLLSIAFPERPMDGSTMGKVWDECERWLPHVLSLRNEFARTQRPSDTVPREYIEVLCNCAYFMWERGSINAVDVATHALACTEELLGRDASDHVYADILTVCAALKMQNFQLRRESADLFERALVVRERYMATAPHPLAHNNYRQLANSYNNTGVARLTLEQYSEALPLFNKSLEIKQTLGNEETIPYDFSISFYNICRVYMGHGWFYKALENAKKALELAEKSNGPNDFRVNQFRFTYADILVACEQVDQGLEIHKTTLAIRRAVMGNENNDTGVSLYGLSCVYQKMRQYENALDAITEAIAIFEKVTDADDRLARSYFRRHLILKDMCKSDDALDALQFARTCRTKLTGAELRECNDKVEEYDSLVSYYNK
ncbi:hypothetical protein FAUST_10974 [Fusarium austroamericanum]|uniref:NB-ARC domain-containing protein n=1 Tax=Fusarium austroamericanum TaxID=282268 RepID=A0AAN6BVK4_FUSAU|nr:hypothetical protein FAUST_10974 [Fusarium austroamericanum]